MDPKEIYLLSKVLKIRFIEDLFHLAILESYQMEKQVRESG